MSQSYAPQRKLLLSLEHEASQADQAVLISHPRSKSRGSRQEALSVPESLRASGEPLAPFFEACGGRTVLSLSVQRNDRDEPPETYVFEQPFVLIGRCPEGDLTLPDPAIGFRHFYLQLIDGRWSFINLARVSRVASANNEQLSGWFEPGDELQAGPYTIRQLDAPVRPFAEGREHNSGAAHRVQPIRLELVNGLSETRHRRARTLRNAITLIGGSHQCDLWLRDESVSGIHAGLVLTPQGAWIVDLLGRNGVLVNRQRVYWKQIYEGTELAVGRFRFRVRFHFENERPGIRPTSKKSDRGRPSRRSDAEFGGSLTGESVLALVRQLADMQSQFFEHSQLQMQLMSEMVAHLRGSQQSAVRQDLARIDEIGRELKDIQQQLARSPAPAEPTARPMPPPARAKNDRSEGDRAEGDRAEIDRAEIDRAEIDRAGARNVKVRNPKPRENTGKPSRPLRLTHTEVEKPPEAQQALPAECAAPSADEAVPDEYILDDEAPALPDAAVLPPEPLPEQIESPPADSPEPALEGAPAGPWRRPQSEPRESNSGANSQAAADDAANDRLTRRMAKLAQERNSRWRRVLKAFQRKPGT